MPRWRTPARSRGTVSASARRPGSWSGGSELHSGARARIFWWRTGRRRSHKPDLRPGEDERQYSAGLSRSSVICSAVFMVTGIAADVQADNTVYLLDPKGKGIPQMGGIRRARTGNSLTPICWKRPGLLLRQQAVRRRLARTAGRRPGWAAAVSCNSWTGMATWCGNTSGASSVSIACTMIFEPMPNGNILVMSPHVAFSRDERAGGDALGSDHDSGPTVQFERGKAGR